MNVVHKNPENLSRLEWQIRWLWRYILRLYMEYMECWQYLSEYKWLWNKTFSYVFGLDSAVPCKAKNSHILTSLIMRDNIKKSDRFSGFLCTKFMHAILIVGKILID